MLYKSWDEQYGFIGDTLKSNQATVQKYCFTMEDNTIFSASVQETVKCVNFEFLGDTSEMMLDPILNDGLLNEVPILGSIVGTAKCIKKRWANQNASPKRVLQTFGRLSIFIFFIFMSCSEDEYVSPLTDMVMGDIEFMSKKDSCVIFKDKETGNLSLQSTEPWCDFKIHDNSIVCLVQANDTPNDRETVVTVKDKQDKTTLFFFVRQKFSKEALYNCLAIKSLQLSQNGKDFIPFMISEDEIHVCVSKEDPIDKMTLTLSHTADSAYIDEVLFNKDSLFLYNFTDFTRPHSVKLLSSKGITRAWKINIYDLPAITITTPDFLPIVSKTNRKEECEMSCVVNDTILSLGLAGIKGRGNSSWNQPKKPYNIKLDKKHSILGMNKSKHWILLANSKYDRTQLHNDVAFEIARMTDYPWVQSGKFVELVFNGKHHGLYYLCEKIRIESDKIDISEITPTDTIGDALTGGYMLEGNIDKEYSTSFSTDYYNITGGEWPLYWEFVKPEDNIPLAQIQYIKNSLNHLESLIYCDSTFFLGEYRKYLDIESVINWWMVENLCGNEESSRTKNMIIYKDRDSTVGGGKFTVGPPWDFDAWSFGLGGICFLPVEKTTWCYKSLLRDSYFINRLKEKWSDYYEFWRFEIPEYIENQYKLIRRSALRNDIMWSDWPYSTGSYEQDVEYMKEAYRIQLEWMNNYVTSLK